MKSIAHLSVGLGLVAHAAGNSVVTNAASAPKVTIANGTVVGRYLPTFGQDLFAGIPYSDPPERFEKSVPRTIKFSGTLDARLVI